MPAKTHNTKELRLFWGIFVGVIVVIGGLYFQDRSREFVNREALVPPLITLDFFWAPVPLDQSQNDGDIDRSFCILPAYSGGNERPVGFPFADQKVSLTGCEADEKMNFFATALNTVFWTSPGIAIIVLSYVLKRRRASKQQ